MNPKVIDFVTNNISPKGKTILEVGSMNVNGSVKPGVMMKDPQSYIGVDIKHGPGVDEICSAYNLSDHFGRESFDIVICCEVMEHIKEWRLAIQEMKRVLKIGGILFITTVDKGFPYHGYPADFWRFSKSDFEYIFRDMEIVKLETDPSRSGVYMVAKKLIYTQAPLHIKLYSILTKRRTDKTLNLHWLYGLYLNRRARQFIVKILPRKIKDLIQLIRSPN